MKKLFPTLFKAEMPLGTIALAVAAVGALCSFFLIADTSLDQMHFG